jgi:hypothetical protein
LTLGIQLEPGQPSRIDNPQDVGVGHLAPQAALRDRQKAEGRGLPDGILDRAPAYAGHRCYLIDEQRALATAADFRHHD